jgi:hypothetical protein
VICTELRAFVERVDCGETACGAEGLAGRHVVKKWGKRLLSVNPTVGVQLMVARVADISSWSELELAQIRLIKI